MPNQTLTPSFSHLMPDTRELNYYTQDLDLAFLLRHYLTETQYQQAESLLAEMGEVASREMDPLSDIANKQVPTLKQFDRAGVRVDEIVYHPAYRELERIAYQDFGIAACSHRAGFRDWDQRVPQPIKFALGYLGMQAEPGVFCPVSMTDAMARVLEKHGSDELKQRFLPGVTAFQLAELQQGAMFLTEKQGGSDVGLTETRALRRSTASSSGQFEPEWELWGDKWFCSNISAELILTLGRPEGAPAGTRGLGLFLVPRTLANGARNAYTIQRLKDKLGTRSMATGEVTLQGAQAYQVGQLERGFVQMTDMINLTRIWAATSSLSTMRRSYLEALVHTRGRVAFGKQLINQPLMRRQLVDLLIEVEGCAALTFETISVLERVDTNETEADQHLLRILTPLCKYYVPKRGEYVAIEALEMRGGNGYVEDWPNARMLRDGIVNTIWEGSSNVIVLDVARVLARSSGKELFELLESRLAACTSPDAVLLATRTQTLLKRVQARLNALLELDSDGLQLPLRGLVERLAQIMIVTLLLHQAETGFVREVDGLRKRKLLIAYLYLRRHLLPHEDGWAADPDRTVLEHFQALVNWEPVTTELDFRFD